jgi:hypothetical protein
MALGPSSTEVELRVRLNHLKNTDVMSKSDAFLVVFIKSDVRPQDGFLEIGRSEVVYGELAKGSREDPPKAIKAPFCGHGFARVHFLSRTSR